MHASNTAHFFLSANTPQGFVSRMHLLYSAKAGWKAFILKGGPGTGKSEFLKRTGNSLEKLGHFVEYIHCTGDYDDIDAIVLPELKTCVLDGTPPHYVEPEFPGAVENIINLGDCWDDEKLVSQIEKIMLFTSRYESFYDRACRYLAAAGNLIGDSYRLSLEYADFSKINRYSSRIIKREFSKTNGSGSETIRFLTGITPKGVVGFVEDALRPFNRVYVVEDDYGIGRLLLEKLRSGALSAGYDVTSCYCPMFPQEKLEHLLIPSLSLAYVTSNRYHKFEGKNYRHIHVSRFLDMENLKQRRPRLSFNRKASHELIDQAITLLGESQANRGLVKNCYISAMNFPFVEAKADDLIKKLSQ